ncbi:hypothetical protein POX_d05831 [Penicillium oxalicum]|uniref:hypothetical protein n=1 Tax=Penicillium oxalicum TaxID=69781 RepID=UPI0020B83D31|nr:hypothetical protein POX_d05831 [Penicillium oxalicum]KAI2790321.1 hypothetical protein POX_d05831 [Penicillium oxalicum]
MSTELSLLPLQSIALQKTDFSLDSHTNTADSPKSLKLALITATLIKAARALVSHMVGQNSGWHVVVLAGNELLNAQDTSGSHRRTIICDHYDDFVAQQPLKAHGDTVSPSMIGDDFMS